MKNIEFKKYPKILPYLEKHLGTTYCKPFEYSDLDEETYICIVTDFINEYEKHKAVLIKNTLLVYNLTNEETGYKCLSTEWDRFGRPQRISKELVEEWWNEKVSYCMLHIYQALQHSGSKIEGGVTGSLITIGYVIQFLNHDKKGYKYNVAASFTFSLNLGHTLYTEYDLHD